MAVGHWAREPVQVRGRSTQYRPYIIQSVKRSIACEKRDRPVPTVYMVYRNDRETKSTLPDLVGSCNYLKTTDAEMQLVEMMGMAEDAEGEGITHTMRMMGLGKQYNVHLSK